MLATILNLFVLLDIVHSNQQRTTDIEDMPYKSYVNAVRTAKLINLIHKIEGNPQLDKSSSLYTLKDNATNEDMNIYESMKLIQKNYDTEKKFKEDRSRRLSQMHFIRNPEVLEEYKNDIVRRNSEDVVTKKFHHLKLVEKAIKDEPEKELNSQSTETLDVLQHATEKLLKLQEKSNIIMNGAKIEYLKKDSSENSNEAIKLNDNVEVSSVYKNQVTDLNSHLVDSNNKPINTLERNVNKNIAAKMSEKLYINDFLKEVDKVKHINDTLHKEYLNNYDANIAGNINERKTNLRMTDFKARSYDWNKKLNHEDGWRKRERNKEEADISNDWQDQGYRVVKNIDWDAHQSDIESKQLDTKYDNTNKKYNNWSQYNNNLKYEAQVDIYGDKGHEKQSEGRNKLKIKDKLGWPAKENSWNKNDDRWKSLYSNQISIKHKADQQNSWNKQMSRSEDWNAKQERWNKKHDSSKSEDSKNKNVEDSNKQDNFWNKKDVDWNKKGFKVDKELIKDLKKKDDMRQSTEHNDSRGYNQLKRLKSYSYHNKKYTNAEWSTHDKKKRNKIDERNNEANVYKEKYDGTNVKESKGNWNSFVAKKIGEIPKKRNRYSSRDKIIEKLEFSLGRTLIPFISKKAIYV